MACPLLPFLIETLIKKTFDTVCKGCGQFLPFQKLAALPVPEFCFLACSILLLSSTISGQELPAGTALEVRLAGATGPRYSHRGEQIEATVIAPVAVQGRILVPQGSQLFGSITNATAIGLGLKHSTASISYDFQTLRLPGRAAIPIDTRLVEVDTAKEDVDERGTVHGIHPIVSLSSGLAFHTVPLLLIEPTIGAPACAVKSFIAPSANPEIYFPSGTEMIFRLSTAVTIPAPHARPQAEHPILTDGDVAVIRLHDCIHPKVMAGFGETPSLHQRGRLARADGVQG